MGLIFKVKADAEVSGMAVDEAESALYAFFEIMEWDEHQSKIFFSNIEIELQGEDEDEDED